MSDFWNPKEEKDRDAMAALMAPLVVAARSNVFTTKPSAYQQTYAWCLGLREVPREIVSEAIDNLVAKGIDWLPKPGDVKRECAAVLKAKRDKAFKTMLVTDCNQCNGSRWKSITVDGVERLSRCDCWRVAVKAMEAAGQPLALPPSEEERNQMEVARMLSLQECAGDVIKDF